MRPVKAALAGTPHDRDGSVRRPGGTISGLSEL